LNFPPNQKQKIHSLLKERWHTVGDREKEVWMKWEEWDEKRYAAELETYEQKQQQGKKRDSERHISASENGIHIPKKKKRMVSY
jgi:hypothetical protein